MAVYPKAVRKLIPPGANDPRIKPTQVILHVAVSEADSLWDYFARRSGGIESHFYIRRDGTVEQYRDTTFEADANHTANSRAISVETQGMEGGEWTPAQVDAIKRLLTWAHHEHGIPLQVAPRHDAPGIGYHVMFGAPGPWTPVAKSCPGPDRVRQFHRDIVPWMSGATTTSEEFDMDENELRRIIRQAVREEFDHIRLEDRDQPKVKRSISGLLLELDKRVGNLERANREES